MRNLFFIQRFSKKAMLCLLLCCGSCFPQAVEAQKFQYALQEVKAHEPFHDGLAVFYEDGKYGAINTNGRVVIKPQFKFLEEFINGTAIARTETGQGIINRNGDFILRPQSQFQLVRDHNFPELYKITDESSGEKGIFADGRFILPLGKYRSLFLHHYPFIHYASHGKRQYVNSLTGEIFDFCLQKNDVFICSSANNSQCYFSKDGNPLDKSLYLKSSNGVYIYKDEKSKLYGLKNAQGTIIVSPKYLFFDDEIWINDMMVGKTNDGISEIINTKGEVVGQAKTIQLIVGNYIVARNNTDGEFLYDIKEKCLLEFPKNSEIYPIKDCIGWFYVKQSGKEKIYDAKNNNICEAEYAGYGDDMIKIRKNDTYDYYINAATGKQVAGPLAEAWGYHEGLAVVRFANDKYKSIIDRNGKIIYKENEKVSFGHYFSEGVLSVEDKTNGTNNYIYNPLGHAGYTYNQTSFADHIIEEWNQKGHEAFAKKKYAIAKDYYYKVMMNDPTQVDAVINYGAALGNMGYYDEAIECCQMALDIEPDNQLAKSNLQINIDNKRIDEEERQRRLEREQEEREEEPRKSSTFWDALGNFANMLGTISGATNVYQQYSSFSIDQNMYGASSAGGGYDYQSQYRNWERRAQSNYESLTNLGYRATRNDGSKTGGTLQSMSGSNYVQMKKNLRDAQHEMQRIRREAARNGVSIQQSRWETATVNY